jgi:hypothetical protein
LIAPIHSSTTAQRLLAALNLQRASRQQSANTYCRFSEVKLRENVDAEQGIPCRALLHVANSSSTPAILLASGQSNDCERKMPEHKIHEHHEKSAHHHEQAAKHHREAAKHHKAGDHEKAAHHSKIAHGHHLHAAEHHEHVSKKHADEHS